MNHQDELFLGQLAFVTLIAHCPDLEERLLGQFGSQEYLLRGLTVYELLIGLLDPLIVEAPSNNSIRPPYIFRSDSPISSHLVSDLIAKYASPFSNADCLAFIIMF